jgi:hypothetical protein
MIHNKVISSACKDFGACTLRYMLSKPFFSDVRAKTKDFHSSTTSKKIFFEFFVVKGSVVPYE